MGTATDQPATREDGTPRGRRILFGVYVVATVGFALVMASQSTFEQITLLLIPLVSWPLLWGFRRTWGYGYLVPDAIESDGLHGGVSRLMQFLGVVTVATQYIVIFVGLAWVDDQVVLPASLPVMVAVYAGVVGVSVAISYGLLSATTETAERGQIVRHAAAAHLAFGLAFIVALLFFFIVLVLTIPPADGT